LGIPAVSQHLSGLVLRSGAAQSDVQQATSDHADSAI
jgi:hypothetical protein